jgi:hypothetical protein
LGGVVDRLEAYVRKTSLFSDLQISPLSCRLGFTDFFVREPDIRAKGLFKPGYYHLLFETTPPDETSVLSAAYGLLGLLLARPSPPLVKVRDCARKLWFEGVVFTFLRDGQPASQGLQRRLEQLKAFTESEDFLDKLRWNEPLNLREVLEFTYLLQQLMRELQDMRPEEASDP